MSNFVLIDHSLERPGGHHFEYALHVARAADAAGFHVVLATHHRFRGCRGLPARWDVMPLFRFGTYSPYASCAGNHRPWFPHVRSTTQSWRHGLLAWGDGWRQFDCRRRQHHFATACGRLFQRIGLAAGDHVFLPTLSEFDLAGLVRYLRSEPATRQPHWHLQFHFGIFAGREFDYATQQVRAAAASRYFASHMAQVQHHRLHYYSTTEPMAAQYNRLGAVRFDTLTYPVSREMRPQARDETDHRPLRITCAGHFRTEKGRDHLADVTERLWDGILDRGRAQILIQGTRRRLRRLLRCRGGRVRHAAGQTIGTQSPVVLVRHPLSSHEYARFIRSADIGLFLYDSQQYFARCSGILVEMLSAGVPVVVPAGCWMADQIAEQIYRHVEQLEPFLLRIAPRQVDGHLARDPDPVKETTCTSFADDCMTRLGVPPTAAVALTKFRWLSPRQPAALVRVQADQFDSSGNCLGQFATVVGERAQQQPILLMIPLQQGVDHVQFSLVNAYDRRTITVAGWEISFHSTSCACSQVPPIGRVGLIAADRDQVPRLLREMIEHYAHYRRTAEQFSVDWARRHDPRETVAALVARARAA